MIKAINKMKLLTNGQICEYVLGWEESDLGARAHSGEYHWNTIDQNGHRRLINGGNTPSFRTDLEAAFNYLVPVLHRKDFMVEVRQYFDNYPEPFTFEVFIFNDAMDIFSGRNKIAAEAFIEAFSAWWEEMKKEK